MSRRKMAWRQLQNQLATYKPSVMILGYGMAASLSGRLYAEQFRTDLERLIETTPKAVGGDVRFLILGSSSSMHDGKA